MKYLFYYIFFVVFIFTSCTDEKINGDKNEEKSFLQEVEVKYAKGFTIEKNEDYKVITIHNPWKGETTPYRYVLYRDVKPEGFNDATFVKIPIKTIGCMSLTHISFLDKLKLQESIVALSGCSYVSNPHVKKLINEGLIKEIGQNQQIDYEMLVDKHPDIIMTYGIDESSKKSISKLKELGLKVVLNAEYMETHPLGQAEWLKFVAAFYDLDNQANEQFNLIEEEYLRLKKMTEKLSNDLPTVFVGMPWNGVWYLAGGKSFQAQLLKDAGANYLWKDNEEKSNFSIDKEVIIDQAMKADFWINLNTYSSIQQVLGFDAKFEQFKSVKEKHLYNNNKRVNENAGNDYWESGIVQPDIILKDLIEIFHPELIDHELYYYQKLD